MLETKLHEVILALLVFTISIAPPPDLSTWFEVKLELEINKLFLACCTKMAPPPKLPVPTALLLLNTVPSIKGVYEEIQL